MSNRVIIAIHGLGRKPVNPPYGTNWLAAIKDGLSRNRGYTGRVPDFRLVYWGDWNHPSADPADEYKPGEGAGAYPAYAERWHHEVLQAAFGAGGEALDTAKALFGIDQAADLALKKRLPDLATYYEDDRKREALRKMLHDALVDVADKRVMLVAHSMGSIVAYDVLRALGDERPAYTVEHFVTIGSPLGLPHVVHKIGDDRGRARVPTIVRRWTNLADRRDPIAFDPHLASDFGANDRGVTVEDQLVINDYRPGKPGLWAHHAAYGYLRTPELSRLVHDFI